VGRACDTNGIEKFWWGNLKEKDNFEDLGVDGRTSQTTRMGEPGSRLVHVAVSRQCGNETSGYTKC
jgi:hypothetical protein